MAQLTALEELWKARPEAALEDLDAQVGFCGVRYALCIGVRYTWSYCISCWLGVRHIHLQTVGQSTELSSDAAGIHYPQDCLMQ
jgi:hypothetical protein